MLSEKLNEIFNRAIPVVTPLPSPDDPLYHAWKESVSQQPETLAEKLAYLKATPALLRQFCILGGAFFLTGIVACVWFYLAQKRFDRGYAKRPSNTNIICNAIANSIIFLFLKNMKKDRKSGLFWIRICRKLPGLTVPLQKSRRIRSGSVLCLWLSEWLC